MVSRIVALALFSAALVVGAGVLAWWQHVLAMEQLVQARTLVAQELYAAGERRPEVLARKIEVPEIHVIVEDHANLEVYDSVPDGSIIHHPGGALPPGPVPLTPPVVVGLPRPPHPPPPGGEHFPRPPRPLDVLASDLAGLPPSRAGSGSIRIIVLAGARQMATFLVTDAIVVGVLVVLIIIAGLIWANRVMRSDRRRLEETAEQRHALVAEYQRFLADAGHELRTPLTIVSGYIDILDGPLAESVPELARAFASMKTETARMRALVEKMLLLARLETPASVPSLLDAGEVAAQAVEAMRSRFPGRDLEHEREGSAPVVIDQDDLYEAVRNLIENALKYAPNSAVRVKSTPAGGYGVLTVTDFGPGISDEEQQVIFERFYRGKDRAEAEGSGLGLAIVQRVADRWRGAIELDSRPAHTTFTLRFPLADEEH